MRNPFARGLKIAPIDPPKAIERVANGTLMLLDVREADEIRTTGIAKGAVHIPLSQVQAKADPKNPNHDPRLSPERAIAVYCVMGARSEKAAQTLFLLDYLEVYNLGGLSDWQRAGGEVEPL